MLRKKKSSTTICSGKRVADVDLAAIGKRMPARKEELKRRAETERLPAAELDHVVAVAREEGGGDGRDLVDRAGTPFSRGGAAQLVRRCRR